MTKDSLPLTFQELLARIADAFRVVRAEAEALPPHRIAWMITPERDPSTGFLRGVFFSLVEPDRRSGGEAWKRRMAGTGPLAGTAEEVALKIVDLFQLDPSKGWENCVEGGASA